MSKMTNLQPQRVTYLLKLLTVNLTANKNKIKNFKNARNLSLKTVAKRQSGIQY